MRNITEVHTGKIITDTDLCLESLFTGDYGKANNIKASFLGYEKEITKVPHKPIDLAEKLVINVSSQKGCPMKCSFCECHKLDCKGNASLPEIMSEASTAIALSGITRGKRLNMHYTRTGEPTFNPAVIQSARLIADMVRPPFSDVQFEEYHPVVSTMCPKDNAGLLDFLMRWVKTGFIYGGKDGFGLQFSINTLNEDDRNTMFAGMSLPLDEISRLIYKLPEPKGRKFTLNFAVTEKSDLDPVKMRKLFDRDRCVIKITPMYATINTEADKCLTPGALDIYSRFERPLVSDGWDVIVQLLSHEESTDGITHGNSLLATYDPSVR